MKGSWLGYGFGFTELSGYAHNFLSDRKISNYLRNRTSSVLFLPGSGMSVSGR